MLFDTPVYFVFLLLIVLTYWRLNWRRQNVFLLAASYFFYGWWDWRFLLLMAASTVIDYVIAIRLENASSPTKRRTLLVASLIVNFSILGFFKYFNFFLDSTVDLLHFLGIHSVPRHMLAIVLPPGISFYTFQEVAYIVDVYSGRIQASRSLLDYALFISLFPHLIAGPIQRPSHLLPQVQMPRIFRSGAFQDGCMLILMGLVRKTVLADNCALLANMAFGGGLGSSAWATLIGAYAFAWQIYGDFSGYSDIARGSAQLLGFHFMVNFRQPYLAVSVQDFWRRWHISLSTWLRDYLYISLGGNREGEFNTHRNLLLTMFLGGLWHGANWTFVAWGTFHGCLLSIERFVFGRRETNGLRHRWGLWIRRAVVFHLVCLGWIFFRAADIQSAVAMLRQLTQVNWMPDYGAAWMFLGLLGALGFVMDLNLERTGGEYVFQTASPARRRAAAVAAIVLLLLGSGAGNVFIYFQF